MASVDPKQVARAVGRRIAEVRVSRGLTQEAFAEALGISVQALRRVELAQTGVTLTRLVRIANALRVRVPAFFEAPRTLKVIRGRPTG